MVAPDRWIVPPVCRMISPNRYTATTHGASYVRPIEALILHYTAGYSHTSSARWLCDKRSGASAHFVVGRAGEVLQLVPLDERAWHAGGSSSRWRGRPVNGLSLGIEIANLGPLTRDGSGWRDCRGEPYAGPVEEHAGDGWEAYPTAQVDAVAWLIGMLARRFPVLAQRDEAPGELSRICGHADVDPSRKRDPGPALPLTAILREVIPS